MTIDRDALQLSAEKKLAAIGAINEDQSNRVGGPWVNAPLEAVLDAILPDARKAALETLDAVMQNIVTDPRVRADGLLNQIMHDFKAALGDAPTGEPNA